MVCLLVDTGVRRGELFGIRWPVIDFGKKEILIDRNIQRLKGIGLYADTPKGKKSRVVSISDEMTDLLKEYQEYQKKELFYVEDPNYNK